jgi:D-serine deaminase-like pyridoxal phosphate-dependent protein
VQPLADFLARVAPPQTPALVVRRAALEANLATMQSACSSAHAGAGVRLRSHGKMHKCSRMALAQVAAGAVGVCCQTVGEAEIYAAAGVRDVMLTAPVPPWGWARLATLARAGARVSAVIDSPAQLGRAAGEAAGLVLFVDVDPGTHRAGVAHTAAPALAASILATPGVSWGGIQAYAGHVQHIAGAEARSSANAAVTADLQALITGLAAAGMAPPQVTGGGTGTYALDLAAGVFTEIQAGSYALMDVEYDGCGAPDGDWPFQPALFMATTVVSAQHRALRTCDAGLKAIHSDGPPPRVVAGAAPGSRWRSMGDEHGAIIHPDFLGRLRDAPKGTDAIAAIDADGGAAPEGSPAEAALVWLQPGHVDPTVALHDAFLVADEDGRLETWPIDARRKTP